MRPYFAKMPDIGIALRKGQIKRTEDNLKQLKRAEEEIDAEI